ncbi:macro domain-containing protein [Ureibacillus sinduriensis]|uniref:Appr-1-p processing protein n=1 Tax=Ureibacillus sinduriensis BLB-1 = JCM 15800 TaxID=1384057 RepID=A0A0A3INW8_9BACL|nr:macro domain-containing protein [Ureibacillus sinduriensis]KGR76532.1 Appr-1-p processing protein [Ureibacillus sinduriensis BLB-1 = JCM 15800]
MPLTIERNDITNMKVDAIVNAANTALKMGGGVCGAIFRAAGADQLQAVCDVIGHCEVGQAVMTEGFHLPADYIIHTVGPIWRGGNHNEAELLASCYKESMQLAIARKCSSIAFPLISSGIYGYPKREALHIAVTAISEFLLEHEINVTIVVFDKQAVQLSKKLYRSVYEYIDDYYVEPFLVYENSREIDYVQEGAVGQQETYQRTLENVLNQMDESFSQKLLRLIDEKGKTDVETYKKANIDRRLFSKIRNTRDYTPMKKTVIAFAIALELNVDETMDLLASAGYTLSNSSKFDLIIRYFIEQKNYNIFEINETLFAFDQVLLGA